MKAQGKREKWNFKDWLRKNRISIAVLFAAALVFIGLFTYAHQGQIYQNQSTELEYISYDSAKVLNITRYRQA